MSKAKGLGRGLDALLGGGAADKPRGDEELTQLAVAALKPGKYQPRTRMDEASLRELADSIKVRGVIQPIIARPSRARRYSKAPPWRARKAASAPPVRCCGQ